MIKYFYYINTFIIFFIKFSLLYAIEAPKNLFINDIEISNDNKGKPIINISNNLKKFLKKKFKSSKYQIFLSLSDEKKYSIAYVIINKK